MLDDRELLKAADKVARAACEATEEQLDACLMEAQIQGDPRITDLAQQFKITAQDLFQLKATDLLPEGVRRRGEFTLRSIGLPCALYVSRCAAERAADLQRKFADSEEDSKA